MAILTNKFISGSNGRMLEIRIRKADGSTGVNTKFLTNLGDVEVVTLQEKQDEVAACTFDLKDNTRKIVVQLHEKFAGPVLYSKAKKQTRLAFENWFQEIGVKDSIMHLNNPYMKQTEDTKDEWIEAVAFVRYSNLGECLRQSGRRGFFVNQFYDKDFIDDGRHRKVWFEDGTSLMEAESRIARYPLHVIGLICNRRGLGVRVPASSHLDMVSKLVSVEAAAEVQRRQGQKIYEISRVPPWVDFDDLQIEGQSHWKWEVELVRYLRRGNTKNILVRAKDAPLKDSIVVQAHILPLQLAPERPTVPVARLNLRKTVVATPSKLVLPTPRESERARAKERESDKSKISQSRQEDPIDMLLKQFAEFPVKVNKQLHDGGILMNSIQRKFSQLSDRMAQAEMETEEFDMTDLSDVDVELIDDDDSCPLASVS